MTDEQKDAYAERAAIMEYDGRMPRETAVGLAWVDVVGGKKAAYEMMA